MGGRATSGGGRRAPSLRLVNGRATTGVGLHTSSTESVRSPHQHLSQPHGNNINNSYYSTGNNVSSNNHPRLNKDDSIKISIENTNTCTDSLVTALDDETLLITDFLNDTGELKFIFTPQYLTTFNTFFFLNHYYFTVTVMLVIIIIFMLEEIQHQV